MAPKNSVVLPVSIVSPIDVGRILREAEALDEFLTQAAVRKTGEPMSLPKTSRLLDEFIQTNNINALDTSHRQKLVSMLKTIKQKAPTVHISFSADPSPQFLARVTDFLRREVHPYILLRVGLQPNIGAGCMLRTTNKYFDFSLRQHFNKHYQYFVDKLHEAVEEDEVAPVPAEQAVVASQALPADEPKTPEPAK